MKTLDFNFCRPFAHTINVKKKKKKKINENSSKKEIEDNEKTQMKYNNYHKDVHTCNITIINYINTTKKQGYPSVFKTAGIVPKSAGIGSKFLSQIGRAHV